MVDRRERVGRSVRDFRHLRGVENGPYVSSTRRRPLSPRLSRQTRRGAMAPGSGGGRRRANWTPRIFTGHKGWPSLRRKLYRTGGHQGTAPPTLFVAFNPLPFPLFYPSPCGYPTPRGSRWHRYGGNKVVDDSNGPTKRGYDSRAPLFPRKYSSTEGTKKKKKKEGAYTFDLIDKIDRRE